MEAALPASSPTLSESTGRLIVGCLASALLHLVLLAGVTVSVPRHTPPTPLSVDIRRAPAPEPKPAGEIAIAPPTEFAGPPAELAPPRAPPLPPEPAQAAPEAPIELPLHIDRYLTGREVDVRAEQINDVQLVYPLRAYEFRTRGRVVLRLLIDERGMLDGVSVLEAEPPGIFEEAALDAAKALQFSPALKWGHPVKSQKTIEVVFNPYDRAQAPPASAR